MKQQQAKYTPQAEALADAILKASGSALRHYSMQKTRDEILSAAQHGIDEAQAELLAVLKDWEAAIPRIDEFASVAPDSLRGRALAAIAKAESH